MKSVPLIARSSTSKLAELTRSFRGNAKREAGEVIEIQTYDPQFSHHVIDH